MLLAEAHQNLGNVLLELRKFDPAAGSLRKALSIFEADSARSNDVAQVLDKLAFATYRDFDEAKKLVTRAIALKESYYGKDHPAVNESLGVLIKIHIMAKEFDKVEPLFPRALFLAEKDPKNTSDGALAALALLGCSLNARSNRSPEIDGLASRIEKVFELANRSEPIQTPVEIGILNSVALSLPRPSYPPNARAARASGQVIVRVVVDQLPTISFSNKTHASRSSAS